MKRFFQMAAVWGALAMASPVAAQAPRDLVLSGIPVRLTGVGETMATASRLVLETQLALAGDKAVSAPLADDLAFFLAQRYLQLGYPQAVVDWRLAGATAVLEVKEGPRRTVGEIRISGVDATQESVLRPYVTRQTREREGRLAKSLPYVQADLDDGLQFVVRKLQADGYLQATAAPPVYAENAAAGSMDISISVTPGPRSLFGTVSVAGDATNLSKDAQAKITALSGQPFNEASLENVRKEVKGDLQSRGWYAAEVTAVAPRAAEAAGVIPAILTVSPGLPFRVTEVRPVAGLSRGATRVATSVFHSAAGDIYDPETLDLLHRRVLDTGIFSRLDVEPVVLGPDSMALSIKGEEAKPKTLGFFGGYETFFGPIAGIEARHVNFGDTGDSVGLRAEIRGTGLNGSLQWTDPAIFGTRNSLGAALALETFTFKDYYRVGLSLRPTLTRRFNRHITGELFSGASLNASESDVLTFDELGPDEYETLTTGGRLTLDYRDNPLNPRTGWLAGAGVEGGFDQGGEENVNFVRTDLNASWYHPLGGPWRVAVNARASSIATGGDVEDVPIDLRLFNGGGTTVRSFAEREMGPKSRRGSTPLGGLATTVLNAELSYQIITNLELAAFADAGSLSREDSSIFTVDDLRYAVGMGIRYKLPIGPLRVDYGFNPDRQPGEAVGALHLTFGFAF